MEDYKLILSLFDEEIKRVNNCQNIEQLLENSNQLKQKCESINNNINDILEIIEKRKIELREIVKSTKILSGLIMDKVQQFMEDNVKLMNTETSKNDTTITEEEINLQKATLKEKYLEKNNLVTELLEAIKFIDKSIEKIENVHSDAVSDVEICKTNLRNQQNKLEEIEKQKCEDELAIKEKERLELKKIKQEAKEAEQRKKEMERIKMILEEEEASKMKTQKSDTFQTFRFDVSNGEFGVFGIGCFIKTLKENMGVKEDLIIELIDPLSLQCNFDATDEIVSNIIEIRPKVKTEEIIQFDKAFSVILPHSMARTQARETKIYRWDKGENKWNPIETQDVTVEEVEKSAARFVEGIFDELPLIITVISVPKVEEVEYGKKGNNWSASVDSRVNMLIPSNAVKFNLTMKITTLAFDSNFTQDVKSKSKGTVVDNIYTFTHLLKIESIKKRLLKPGIISLPLAQKQALRSENINMPLPALVSNSDSRSKSAFGSKSISDIEDEVRLLILDGSKQWQQSKDLEIEVDKKKDSIKFEVPELTNLTILGVRVKPEASSEQINKGVSIIMEHFKLRQIKMIITNNLEDLNLYIVTVCPLSRIDKQLSQLQEEGYNVKTPLISQEIEIKEREILTLRFRGNVKVADKDEDFLFRFMYCSQLRNRIKLRLEVVDKYAQKVKPMYQGFLTVTMSTWLKKPQPKVEGQTRKGPAIMMNVEEIIPLYEAILCIPKLQEVTKSFTVKDFNFYSKDSINPEFLKVLSTKIKNDWKHLAKALDISNKRIEEISSLISDNKKNDELAYEILKIWIINLPVSKNKEQLMKRALININREDLVDTWLSV